MQLSLHPFTLQLKEVFTISRGSYSQRKTLIVELAEGEYKGYGEASEHSYYHVTQEAMIKRANELRSIIEDYDFETPEKFHQFLKPQLNAFPFLQCAIDNAAHDLYGKIKQSPSHQIWNLNSDQLPKCSYTLGIDTIEKMVEKIKTTQFDIYKIKLGTPHDMDILKALRQHSTAIFRVDANCAWTVEETIKNSEIMKTLGVEFIEQPLKADDWHGMEKVFQHSALPIISDEACKTEKDIERSPNRFHGVNIKLMKSGGITPALRMIEKARSLDLKIMFGCMVESSVGIAAIAQLLPLMDYVDMDGALLLTNDPASGAKILNDGSVVLPNGNGLGIEMN